MATSFLGQLMAVKHLQACTKLGVPAQDLFMTVELENLGLQVTVWQKSLVLYGHRKLRALS